MMPRVAKQISAEHDSAKEWLVRRMNEFIPDLKVLKVEIEEKEDSDGQPSLFVHVLLARHMKPAEIAARMSLRADFRMWLLLQGDDRFPYFEFVTKSDLRERNQSN
ncbi:MAG: hypothetical protein EPN33_09110 [Acidobacteria bacterium]|nr:MAG: hypothetical protein EPN33_09110 [Acidobacteriota bacterium]